MTTYFACISYSKCYRPRAIFIPMKNISKELLDKITKITSLGNVFDTVFEFNGGIGKCIGYNIDGRIETSKEISDIVNFFQGLVYFLEMDGFIDDYDNIKNHQEPLITKQEINNKNEIKYPDNYNGIPIDYPNILFWYVDVNLDLGYKNILANYKIFNGKKINLFDYVVISF